MRLLFQIILVGFCASYAYGIGCYVCSSINGSDPRCEDQFNAFPGAYQETCMAARNNRKGLFPATWCIKFKASKGNHTIMVRDCALDNGGITKDFEIGTLDHCGWARELKYDNVDMKGCLMVCDQDGCNKGNPLRSSLLTLVFIVCTLIGVAFH